MLLNSTNLGVGWVPPATASDISQGALQYAMILGQRSPLFGIDRPWGWQIHTLAMFNDRKPDGSFRYRKCAVIICRQNGKTTLLFFHILDRLSLGRTILFTLHERQKAREKWEEVAKALTAAVPSRFDVSKRIGSEQVTDLYTGGKFRLVTPDDAGGRSDTADDIIVDECAHIKPSFLKAAEASTLTKPHAQTIQISSGMTDKSEDLAATREAAYQDLSKPAAEQGFGVLEWAAKTTVGIGNIDIYDEAVWHQCIPTLGLPGGATLEGIRDLSRKMPPVDFARECLSIPTGSPLLPPITSSIWDKCRIKRLPKLADLRNKILAVDTSPNQTQTSIVIAAMRGEKIYAGILANDYGDDWLLNTLIRLVRKVQPLKVLIDAKSPAAQVSDRIERRGWEVELTGPHYMAKSCAAVYTNMSSGRLRVVEDDVMSAAALGAIKRDIADSGWAWNRRSGSNLDITPLVCLSLAAYRSDSLPR